MNQRTCTHIRLSEPLLSRLGQLGRDYPSLATRSAQLAFAADVGLRVLSGEPVALAPRGARQEVR